jgi:hypothetical protein
MGHFPLIDWKSHHFRGIDMPGWHAGVEKVNLTKSFYLLKTVNYEILLAVACGVLMLD